jgi:hypothetical protein
MNRKKFTAWALYAVVFLVGVSTLVQQVGGWVSHVWQTRVSHVQTIDNSKSDSGAGGDDQPIAISAAKFNYLIPGKSAAWKMEDSQTAYDPAHAIVKYQVTFINAKLDAVITQQVFPDQLKPRRGDKFTAFINSSKPTRSADVNSGTVYFLPALQNGQLSASGTDTVIFARNDVLIFGQAHGILGWDAWTQMMASMQKHS